MRSSIRKWLVIFFVVTLLLTVAVAVGWSAYDTTHEVEVSSEQKAVTCFELTRQILDDWYAQELKAPGQTDLNAFSDLHPLLQKICTSHDMEYLYVYQASVEEGRRYYLAFAERLVDQRDGESLLEVMNSLPPEEATPLDALELSALAGDEGLHPMVLDNEYGYNLSWLVPYKDQNGRVLGLIGAEMSVARTQSLIWRKAASVALPVIGFLLVAFTVALVMINRRIIGPIHRISQRMEGFVKNRSQPREPLNVKPGDEIGEIAQSFEKMSDDITEYLRDIEVLTKERLEADVQENVARRIQYGLVPEHTALDGQGYSIRAFTRPARAVGGDFYDCFVREDGKLCLLLGDVSGKGISAALFMAIARTVLHDLLKMGLGPAEALNRANGEMCESNPEGLFATVFAAVLDPVSRELRYANAGHNYPVLAGTEAAFFQPDPGVALGLFEDAGILEERRTLEPGQRLLLYTDGVTEAVDGSKEFFGEERLLRVVGETPEDSEDPAGQTVDRVLAAVEEFTTGCEQFDDICMVALAMSGAPEEPGWETLPAKIDSFDRIRQRVTERMGNTPRSREILLVCEEVLVNIVSYAGVEELRFFCGWEDHRLTVCFSDRGMAFDPTQGPREEREFEEKDLGGMGLGLLRDLTDRMEYRRVEGENRLTLGFDESRSG